MPKQHPSETVRYRLQLYRLQIWREEPRWHQCAPILRLTSEQIAALQARPYLRHAGHEWQVAEISGPLPEPVEG